MRHKPKSPLPPPQRPSASWGFSGMYVVFYIQKTVWIFPPKQILVVLQEIKSSLFLEFTASNEDNGDTTEMAHVSPRSNVFGHDDEGYDSSKVIRRSF